MKRFIKTFFVVFLIVLLDQGFKLWVYANMEMGLGKEINLIGDFFKLKYTLNSGMAFGLHLGFKYGKLLITVVRVSASFHIFYYIIQSIRTNVCISWIWGWALILAGAIGNAIDSVFYGVCLNNAPSDAPMKWLYGQVIDMICLDIAFGPMSSWVPIWSGYYLSSLPIFNIADIAISVGLVVVFWTLNKDNAKTNRKVING